MCRSNAVRPKNEAIAVTRALKLLEKRILSNSIQIEQYKRLGVITPMIGMLFVCDITVWAAISRSKICDSLDIGRAGLARISWEGILHRELLRYLLLNSKRF